MARYLVVDDDATTVRGMARLLTEDGHDVFPCTGGADAVRALADRSFDAVVTDLEMPHVDGHAVVRKARLHSPDACVAVVSSRASEAEQALAEAGACMLVDKPVDYQGLTRAIATCREQAAAAGRPCFARLSRDEPLLQIRR